MVNIPSLTMDDYGLLEPTDVGTMTIDYDPKDEIRRRINRWDYEEVMCMLGLIKEHNLVTRYSVTKMSNLLNQMMLKHNWNRTEKQIQLKLTTLRKNYLACEKQKLVTGTIKECAFYKELREVYRDASNSNGIDSEDNDTSSQDECLIKFPTDPINWTRGEVQKMLNLIKSMRLKNELTLTFFSPVAVKMIAEAMHNSGFDRSTEQVKNALINLRTMYIDYKIGFDNNENPAECIFYPCLDMFWGKEYKKCRLKEKRKIKPDDSWSLEETIILLTLVQDLNIAEAAYKNTEKAAESLRQSLAENGYCRSKQQVTDRLNKLKSDFINVHTSCIESEAVKQFPFYNLYKKLFERQFTHEIMNQSNLSTDRQRNSLEYADFCANAKETSESHKVTYWSTEEVKLLLKKVQELTTGSQSNDSLEDEKLQKLVSFFNDSGYYKTAEQIKQKLSLLKNSYLKCNLEDSSEKDIFECPFYNELHDIFQTPVSDERYEFIQNLLSESMDLSASKFSDHSYTNVRFGNSSSESRVNDKVTVVPNKSLDTWFPVESIIDDEGMTAASSLNFNNLSGISNKEHEQIIENAILASLPNTDSKIDENRTIVEPSTTETQNSTLEQSIRPSTTTNDSITEKSDTTSLHEPDYSKIYRYEDPDNPAPTNLAKKQAILLGDEDGPPPNKKSKVTEDEKVFGKNKILLRPVDMNTTSSLNLTNNKFVRLIVANEPSNSKVNHITAHIEPLNINTASSVSSGMSSPVDRPDILKLATEKILNKEDCDIQKFGTPRGIKNDCPQIGPINCPTNKNSNDTNNASISEFVKEAVQNLIIHNELMQQKHHAWMEKQFEIQRKHDEDQKKMLMNELKELRSIVTVLLTEKQHHVNNQNR